jgi:asparagine synthase (glutamine-hydrolysing)
MCGIFGIIGFNVGVPSGVLQRATQSLVHRGPDDGGTVILRDSVDPSIEIGLGNRRLAILDLSPLGHQPMHDPESGNYIVYNGEIYNFREIRARLLGLGFHFRSGSDTEVILKAYAHWGEECVNEFRGMFAFAIWDAERHRLFMARDPMGIKPLYYFHSDRYVIFSSEVRTLLGTDLIPRRLDPSGLLNYLTFGSVYDPNTLVEGISALAAGDSLTWQAGRLIRRTYCDLLESTGPGNGSLLSDRQQGESEVAEMLDEAVRMQLISDVPVGVFLSGGIDSSALVAILARHGVRTITFSIVFREAQYSEAQYSRAIARLFRTDHHEVTVSQPDLFSAIGPAIHAMDLPTIDGVNTYFISQRTRAAGVKVALSGLGGDEVFAGYSSFSNVPRMERFVSAWNQVPASARSPLARAFAAFAPANDRNRKLATLAHGAEAFDHPYILSRMLFSALEQEKLLVPKISEDHFIRARNAFLPSLARAQSLDPVNRVSYLETRGYMLNTLLRDSDSMSMAHGLEVRVPLIDHQLARRVLAMPGAWKANGGTPKPLLVHALKGQLPDSIVHRKKRGFTLPFEHWLRQELRPVVEKSLARIGESPLGSLISEPACFDVWKNFLAGRTSWTRPWSLFVLQNWCELNLSN